MSQNQQLSAFGTTVTVNTAANTVLFASQIVVGNSTVNNTINATSVSAVPGTNVNAQYTWSNTQTFSNTITFSSTINGTANNSLYLGGTAAASYALTSSLSAYQTTAGLSGNVATLTANNSTYAFGKSEGNLNVNSATYATSAGSATNASAATNATNASNLGGTAAASYALKADTHYIGTTAIALNRASASQSLTGITSIDGSAASATNATYATSAGSATNATYATSAGSATNAGSATEAGRIAGTLITSATMSGGSYGYTGFTSSYKFYTVYFYNMVPVNNDVSLHWRMHSGGAYQTASYYTESYYNDNGGSGGTSSLNAAQGFMSAPTPQIKNDGNQGIYGYMLFPDPTNTSFYKNVKWWVWCGGYFNSNPYNINGMTNWRGGTGSITGFQLYFTAGNISKGEIRIYGSN